MTLAAALVPRTGKIIKNGLQNKMVYYTLYLS